MDRREEAFRAVEELRALDTRTCRCNDKRCADAIPALFSDWTTRHAETAWILPAEQSEIETIVAHMNQCLEKAYQPSGAP